VLYVDGSAGVLVAEYLHDYVPYARSLEQGHTLSPAPSLLSSLAAHCHVSSMHPHCHVDRAQLLRDYANQEHVDFWNKCFFSPVRPHHITTSLETEKEDD
jgi:hypothetical protein